MEHLATVRRITILIGLFLFVGGVGGGYAQSLSDSDRERLAPRLRSVAVDAAPDVSLGRMLPRLDPASSSTRQTGLPRYGVFIQTSDLDALREGDVPVHPLGSTLASARVTPAGLRTLARTEGVTYVEPARTYKPLNDVVRGVTGANSLQEGTLGRRYSGEGVLACIVDTGIDWSHPDFRSGSDKTRSRIRSIWDQTLRPTSPEDAPAPFGYGVEYHRRDIEAELDGNRAGQVRSTDEQGHGTHVAATIAGNGAASPDQKHRGLAPQADIVAVKTDFSGTGIAEGVHYCGTVADDAERPVVVNLSLGRLSGPQDDSSPLARAIDAFTGPGRSVVVAAGNSGHSQRHVSHSIPAGTSDSLTVRVPQYSPRGGAQNDVAFHLETWIPDTGPISTEIITPQGDRVSVGTDTAAVVETAAGAVVYEHALMPQGDHRFELLAHDGSPDAPPSPGTWTIAVSNRGSRPTTGHGWLTYTNTTSTLPEGDAHSTVTTPATARSALTVGAWTHRGRWQAANGANASVDQGSGGTTASFSSRGPLRGGGQKPDLLAPGQWVVSARARASAPPAQHALANDRYALYRGTSAASAATAGAVALLFEENASLAPDRVATLLTESAQTSGTSDGSWTADGGHGRLDVFTAMAELRGMSIATHGVEEDNITSTEEQIAQTVGGGGADAFSRRFTPRQSGGVDGLFVRTASGNANRLQDSLTVSIWTNNAGRPGQQIGTPIQISPDVFANHTTNVVSLARMGAEVEAHTDYHVVLTPGEEGGELDVASERQSPEGRSFARRSGNWASIERDLGLHVSTSFAVDLSTPRLSEPGPEAIVDASTVPTLSWESDPNAGSYTVQVSSEPDFPPEHTDTLETATPSVELEELTPSTSYHWRVRAQRFEYSGSWSQTRSFVYYPPTLEIRASRSFETANEPSPTPRLVGLAGRETLPVAQTVEGPEDDWQAYLDRGQEEKALVSFDGSSAFRFQPGNGFWLRSVQEWRVRASVPTVPLAKDGTYAVDVHRGWNIISNPFELDISWGAVDAVNEGALSPLWRFSGQFERTNTLTSARSGEAFYFYNDDDRTTLHLPYPAFPGLPSATASSKEGPPTLRLTAYGGDVPLSRVRVGEHENASEERDAYDEVAPPNRFARTSLRLAAPEEGSSSPEQFLSTEYRPAGAEGHTFSLILESDIERPLEIRADELDAFQDQQVVLIDPAAGESYDLRTSPQITVPPEGGTRSFQLLIGNAEYVETKKETTLPSNIQFLPNYPNPFGEQTTLEYVLPNPASVRLAVYDVLGREVRVLVDQKQQAGRHTVQWDGRDQSGRRLASGVYLARLVVDGTTNVRKLTFVQ